MVLLDEIGGLRNMTVDIPDTLINSAKIQLPELSVVSIYNCAAGAWLQNGSEWLDWLDAVIEQSFDELPEYWDAIYELLEDCSPELQSHFECILNDDERSLYDVEPLGDNHQNTHHAVAWVKQEV